MSILNNLVAQFDLLVRNSQNYGTSILKIMAGLWGLNIINWLTASTLNTLGNCPRSKRGLLGIICSWLLHANFNHLFFNSIPLFILSLILISINKSTFINISIMIIVLEGIMVWLFARKGNHIGASGLIAGYFSYLLIHSYMSSTILSISLGIVILYYFGGILLSIFPTAAKISWEGHLFGIIAGIISFMVHNFYHIKLI